MLQICRRFYTTKTSKVVINNKTKKIVDNFFEKNDKNGKIREALKYGNDEIKKQIEKNKQLKNNKK